MTGIRLRYKRTAADAAHCYHKILGTQHAERLSYRAPADTKHLRELRLDGQALFGLELSPEDKITQLVSDLLIRRPDSIGPNCTQFCVFSHESSSREDKRNVAHASTALHDAVYYIGPFGNDQTSTW